MAFDPLTAVLGVADTIINKLFPDPAQRDAAKLEMLKMQQSGELDAAKIQMSAIIAEAQSADPWTSRARPSFLYIFYLVIVVLTLIAPLMGVFFPNQMAQFYTNVAAGFKAIPESMWATFTVGYLGYTAARQYGKAKGSDK
jgi:hypothetical protein